MLSDKQLFVRLIAGFDESGQGDVAIAETIDIMRWESDIDFVVDVEPFRVVVHTVGLQRHSSHETKRFVEVFEEELLFDGIPTRLVHRPLVDSEQWIQFTLPLLFREFASFW